MKGEVVLRIVPPAVALALAASCMPASAQTGTPPLLNILDFSGDSTAQPLVLVTGAQPSSTLGIEVTSQSVTPAGTAPSLSGIMGSGFGGLSLVQLGGATSSTGQGSPFFSICGQQYGTAGVGGQGPDCWSWQVLGGAGSDPTDVLQLIRTTTTNKTFNVTVLFPPSINLATASNPSPINSAGQMTVGPAPYSGPNANVPSTFTGAGTSDTTSAAVAGPITVEPGQLLATSPDAAALEGALQILQSYRGSNGTMCANCGRLACPSGTAQSVVLCTTTGQAENWVGVYNSIVGQVGGTITPLRYGRVAVKSSSAVTPWTNGDFVCKDDTTASYSEDNSNTPCPIGESIGIAVGDPTGTNLSMHLVDLVPEASVGGGALLTFFCVGTVSAGATTYMFPSAIGTNCQQTVGEMQPVSFAGTIKNLEVVYGTAPGATHTDTFTILKCPALTGCATTGITCQVSGAGTPSTCSDTSHTASVAQGDGVQIQDAAGTGSGAKDARVTIQIQ